MASTKQTKSGRVIKKPERFENLKFVIGSGFVGCDHYDHGYNRGKFSGYEKVIIQYPQNLANFVVADDKPIELESDYEDEKEWSGGETSEEEEEWCESDYED